MKDTGHVIKKLTLIFFPLLGIICHFSINIRVKVHFFSLHWEMKGHWSCVNFFPHLYEMPVSADCSISLKNEKDMHSLVLYRIDIFLLRPK